ncbi:MAG TPA: NAD(P)-dependent oxidoreductase, partial [Spirochaetia bacterium]|nr:NAD(P)-dependent oxidoreductase [Spirochaetia bacterium]
MAGFRVVVTDDRFGSYEEEKRVLEAIGCTLEVCNLSDAAEAARNLPGSDALLVNLFPMTSAIIETLDRCRIISRYGVGYDNVDVDAATRKGIWVARVPDYGFEEVSDHALAMLLALARNLPYVDRRIREGGWNLKNEYRNYRVKGSVLGIVGFGLIGRALCRKAAGLGFSRVLIHDPYVTAAAISRRG